MGQIVVEKQNGVAIITISAPEVRNALTPAMGRQMVQLCDEIDADANIGAAVVIGDGGTFCSGADTRSWEPSVDQSDDSVYKDFGAVYSAFKRVGELAVPTIAAVRGSAVGAGFNLMLATDLRVLADNARIFAGYLRISIHPGGGLFHLAGRTAGREATAALGLFGEEIDGVRARELGIAWECVPDDQVEKRAIDLALNVAADPELAREAVRSFRIELGPPAIGWDAALTFERSTQMWSHGRRNKK